jgi:hypothetical protein
MTNNGANNGANTQSDYMPIAMMTNNGANNSAYLMTNMAL